MMHRPRLSLVTFTLVAFWAASALAQSPEVRSLFRDPRASRPTTLDTSAVSPLYDGGAPTRVGAWLSNGEAATCRTEMSSWVGANGRHAHVTEARFVLGLCAHESGAHAEAFRVLSTAVTEVSELADIAAFHAALSGFQLEEHDAVVALTLAVPESSVYYARSRYLRARSLRELGRHHEAEGLLRHFVDTWPGAWYVASVELDLAGALLELSRVDEAAAVYQRVAARYPDSREEERARQALESLEPRLSEAARARLGTMSDEDVVARATALFERHRSEQVIALLEDPLARLTPTTTLGCEAHYLVGKSYSKLRRHAESVPFYEAIANGSCDEDMVVKALYNAGRSLWNEDRDQDAIVAFRRLYTDHATHSYADDAILYEARIERSNGNETRYLQLLESQIAQFPEGDMLGDANWLLFEHAFSEGHDEQAVAFADAVAHRSGETTLYNRGRIAYFRARALERSGRADEANASYAQVARDVPLSYYALLALNRLHLRDAEQASALVAELHTASAAERVGVRVEPADVADNAYFRRGLLLLRLGLLDLAGLQFDRLSGEYPNQDSVLWLVAFLFDAAGAYHISHDIPRRQIESFLSAWPTPETRAHWELAYPAPFGDVIRDAANERGLDPFLAYAIIREESGFNPRSESWANARGLMQLMMPTAEEMADRVGRRNLRERDLFRAEVAVQLGTEYLRVLGNRYGNHPVLTIAGYNGGIGNVDGWVRENGNLPIDHFVEEIPYQQTRDYTKRVLMTFWIYRWLYGEQPLLTVPFQVPSPS